MRKIGRYFLPFLFFLMCVPFTIHAQDPVNITWTFDSREKEAFSNNLSQALGHVTVQERNIQKVFVCQAYAYCPQDLEKGVVGLYFDPQKSFETLVDELIEKSKPKPRHPELLPTVRVMVQGGMGAGFFWGPDGYVVTCAHIVRDRKTAMVVPIFKELSFSSLGYLAHIVARDDFSDLALLKLDTNAQDVFLKRFQSIPSALVDQREWRGGLSEDLLETRVRIFGFPSYNNESPIWLHGTILNTAINHWGIRTFLVDFLVDRGISGGAVFSQEGFIKGFITQGIQTQQFGSGGGLAIDFYSAEFILKQLKKDQKVRDDILIRRDDYNHLVAQRAPRNFEYLINWNTEEAFLTFRGLVFINACTKLAEQKREAGVRLFENHSKFPEISTLKPKEVIIIKVNGQSTIGFGFENGLIKLSWILRSIPSEDTETLPFSYDVVREEP